MKFEDALVQLQDHSAGVVPMYRKGWDPQDGYVVFMPGMGHAWKIVLQPAPNAGNYMWSMADMVSDDWEIYVLAKADIEV